jgi:hypothetical protein
MRILFSIITDRPCLGCLLCQPPLIKTPLSFYAQLPVTTWKIW